MIRQDLAGFLRMNQDVFVWSHEDVPGIDPLIIVHRLNVNPASLPIRQKKWVFAQERDKAVAEEVRKLLEAGFIREPRLVSKCGHGQEEQRKVEDVR